MSDLNKFKMLIEGQINKINESVDRCKMCDVYVDTDSDPDCYMVKGERYNCICPRCREENDLELDESKLDETKDDLPEWKQAIINLKRELDRKAMSYEDTAESGDTAYYELAQQVDKDIVRLNKILRNAKTFDQASDMYNSLRIDSSESELPNSFMDLINQFV